MNSFELASPDPELAATLANAVDAVGRKAVVLSLSIGRAGAKDEADFSPAALGAAIATALERTRADRFDAVILDEPGAGELPSTPSTCWSRCARTASPA